MSLYYLDMAGKFAKVASGCTKVSVGSCIVTEDRKSIVVGANRVNGNLCKYQGCLRVKKYGDNAKTHRNPDAICNAASRGINVTGATIYVTRYPCEACARAIAASGIKRVVYGRNQLISEQTKQIFDSSDIRYHNQPKNMEDDTND